MTADDKYTYPGSGGVLRNTQEVRTRQEVDILLNRYATIGWFAIQQQPPADLGFGHLQHIHRTLFSSVLDWAGEIRDVDVQAGGTGIAYARPRFIRDGIEDLFSQLGREDYLAGIDDADNFARLLADRWGYLTTIHPFRDGNTRSQSAYVSQLARRAGHPIDWRRASVSRLREARLMAVGGRETALAELLAQLVKPKPGTVVDVGPSPLLFRGSTAASSGQASTPGSVLACGAWMPRARKPCILPDHHSGHHRSILRRPR